ncbi:YpmS family protein [Cytobacillus sp. IB215665]|uniref:YpmS family protein n=1 Tax=Cytobacillus sp. IB215665 TaxID=3097357 RepID=UPI002A117D63|nr:YpmS family protein [Cytobacillus sp. IB215665]MDX8366233.1 YpmS family protein [Cytobacillus sp. IB215665]
MKEQYWKWLFLGLLTINIIVVFYVSYLIMQSDDHVRLEERSTTDNEYSEFLIRTNKQELNELINYNIKKQSKDQPIEYEVILGETVELIGTVSMFGNKINMVMDFIPDLQEDGTIVLQQQSMSVGNLQIPVSAILKYISNHYPIPDWITIQPSQKLINVNFNELQIDDDGMKMKFNKFDLANDHIEMVLLFPALN